MFRAHRTLSLYLYLHHVPIMVLSLDSDPPQLTGSYPRTVRYYMSPCFLEFFSLHPYTRIHLSLTFNDAVS